MQRLGQSRPSKLEICRGHDHRTPTARKAARSMYQQHLRRALERNFPEFSLTRLSNAMDLERSFGPIYARGILRKGRTAFAVLGVNQEETQSIDRCRTDIRHPVAGRMPQFGRPWRAGRRHEAVLAARDIGADLRAHGASQRRRGQVAALRVRRAPGRVDRESTLAIGETSRRGWFTVRTRPRCLNALPESIHRVLEHVFRRVKLLCCRRRR